MKLHRKAALIAMFLRFKGGARAILAGFFYDLYMTLIGKKGTHSRRFLLSFLATILVFFVLLYAVSASRFVGLIILTTLLAVIAVERTF